MVVNLIIYTTPTCPRCEILKKELTAAAHKYKTADLADPISLTELRINGIFTLSAPVVEDRGAFFTVDDLFDDMKLRPGVIKRLFG